jgi:hypothetical protein
MSHARHAAAFAILAFAAGAAPAIQASVVTVPENGGAVFRKDGSKNTPTNGVGRLGAQTSSFTTQQGRRSVVYVFQLPAPPVGQSPLVVDASLHFTIVTDEPDGAYNIDLSALPARPQITLLGTDGSPLTPAALIQDNIIVQPHPDRGVETINTSPAANATLASYLNDQYAGGLGIGQYVFLRLNPDVDPLPNEDTGMDVAFGNAPTGIPLLNVTFAPEPGIAVGTLSLMLLTNRQRRRAEPAPHRPMPA